MTDEPAAANAAQSEYWNSDEGSHWVREQDRYDRMLEPFIDPVLDAGALTPTDRVLDVGCGTGATGRAATIRAAAVTGVDISEPMIVAARNRAEEAGLTTIEFTVADVQTATDLPPVDVVISRFGVMFFDDPVAAFTNLRRSGGRLAFVCWQPMLANEWMTVPAFAAAAHVGIPTPPDPTAPGPFAFGDADHVRTVLTDAGWSDIGIEPFGTPILLGGPGTVEDAVAFLRSTGMGRILFSDAEAPTVAAALDAVREALTPHAEGDGVRLDAATWIVTARA